MKKILLAILLFAVFHANAQTSKETPLKKNEIKLDLFYLVSGIVNVSGVKIEYERLLNRRSSVGLMGFYGFAIQTKIQQQALGFYRLHFIKRPKSLFFIESNIGLTHGMWMRQVGPSIFDLEPVYYTRLGSGVAVGWKFVIPQNGIVFDVYAGRGVIIAKDFGFWSEIKYPRLGICLGKRF